MRINKRLLTLKGHLEMEDLMPDYTPPSEYLGTKETSKDGFSWNKKLAKYKTGDHDPNWVYAYITDHGEKPFATVICVLSTTEIQFTGLRDRILRKVRFWDGKSYR